MTGETFAELVGDLRRPAKTTVGVHLQALHDLNLQLRYLTPGNRDALAATVRDNAGGPNGDTWPAVAQIVNWAHVLQPPPDEDMPLVREFMKSEVVRKLDRDGDAEMVVAVRKFLRRNRKPPQAWGWTQIRETARNWRAKRMAIRQIAPGEIGRDDAEFLRGFDATYAICVELVWPDGREKAE